MAGPDMYEDQRAGDRLLVQRDVALLLTAVRDMISQVVCLPKAMSD
jgi:hypothetical protein